MESALVKTNINLEAGFTEGQVKALRSVFSEFQDEIDELMERIELLEEKGFE